MISYYTISDDQIMLCHFVLIIYQPGAGATRLPRASPLDDVCDATRIASTRTSGASYVPFPIHIP